MEKTLFVLITGILYVTAKDVEINNDITIVCPLPDVTFPKWTGPTTLATPLTDGQTINEPGIEWVDDKNLKILSVETKHTGQYSCSSGDKEGLAEGINVLTYNVTVSFLNVDKEDVTNTERLVGEIDKNMTVTCQANGGNPAPDVTIVFDDDATNAPAIGPVTIIKEMTEENTYQVNASVTFNANGSVDYKYIICSASYPDKNSTDGTILIYLLRPPLMRALTISKFPSLTSNQMKLSCDTTSRPETQLKWLIDDKNITESGLNIEEDNPECIEDSATHIFTCMSNITINDIKKEDNGKSIYCESNYRDDVTKTSPAKISLPYRATNIVISGNTSGVINSVGKVTLTLTCATDAANPAEKLNWYIGSEKTVMNSTYPVVEIDEMYDGKNVSQDIDIVADRTMNKQEVSCCADTDLCTMVTLDIQYPPILLAPQLSHYRAYTTDNISIPCIADSSPVAYIAWFRMEGQESVHISNNTDDPSNIFYLQVVNISSTDATTYECKAWSQLQDISKAVTKLTTLAVYEKPAEPIMETTFDADKFYIEIKTGTDAPDIPRKFYIQYKKVDEEAWREVDTAYDDTLPGQESTTYSYGFKKSNLDPDCEYEVRIKSVDDYGLISYTAKSSFRTDKEVVTSEEEMVSMTKYRNAILISVFATAGVFLTILTIFVCAVKRGKCGSFNSSKSYVM